MVSIPVNITQFVQPIKSLISSMDRYVGIIGQMRYTSIDAPFSILLQNSK